MEQNLQRMYPQNKPWAGSENVQVDEQSTRGKEGKEKEVATRAKLPFWKIWKSCLSGIQPNILALALY